MSMSRAVAGSTATRAALAVGTAVSVACFLATLLLESTGRPRGGGSGLDPVEVVRSAASLEAWGWATLGTYAVILTPALALAMTAWEYLAVEDRRTAAIALAILAILGAGLIVALWR
jgi:hypothetical protein